MLTGMATYSGVCSEGVKILIAHFTPEACNTISAWVQTLSRSTLKVILGPQQAGEQKWIPAFFVV